jgi:hypothetical protein
MDAAWVWLVSGESPDVGTVVRVVLIWPWRVAPLTTTV